MAVKQQEQVTLTVEEARKVRALMGSMPYGAGLCGDYLSPLTSESLIRFLEGLRTRLQGAPQRYVVDPRGSEIESLMSSLRRFLGIEVE